MPDNLISTESTDDKRSLYERDYYTWALQQARALKEHRLEELDWENLSDEVAGLASSEWRELRSRLKVLLEHLIKWQFQPKRRTRSWRATVAVQRVEIRQHVARHPGLKPSIPDALGEAYEAARVEISIRFLRRSDPQPPDSCPWTFEQVMDDQFWPK
jgi:Domain of unknown function DUF29